MKPIAWLSPDTKVSCPLAYSDHEVDDEIRKTYTPLYAIPEGWVLVPTTPTTEMINAQDLLLMRGVTRGTREICAAMLAAAPVPPND